MGGKFEMIHPITYDFMGSHTKLMYGGRPSKSWYYPYLIYSDKQIKDKIQEYKTKEFTKVLQEICNEPLNKRIIKTERRILDEKD
jgi:hypothetical protein